jgi:hypothetical protein
MQCNDTPDEHPIFSWLSPQQRQRLQLVREGMVGLLCPDNALPLRHPALAAPIKLL